MRRQDSLFLTGETNGTIDSSENYVYDGNDIVLVFDGSNNLTDRYLQGPPIDQVFAAEDSAGNVLCALADNRGTIRDVADYNSRTDTTTISNHIKYDAFGNITAESNSSINFLYSYTGRIYDADAELYYYRARWYDLLIGRFIGEDPLGIAAGDVNLSRYVTNSATNFTDPSGLDPQAETDASSFVNTGTAEFSAFQNRGDKNIPLGPPISAAMSTSPGKIDYSTPIEYVFDEYAEDGDPDAGFFAPFITAVISEEPLAQPKEVSGLIDDIVLSASAS